MYQVGQRHQSGSGIIEGVLGLLLVLGGAVGGSLLVLNSGAGIFFKNKIMLVSSQAAQYAAAHAHDGNLQNETQAYVQNVMAQVGLAPSNLSVKTTPATIGGQNGVTVAVSNLFPLFGNGSVLPYQIQLSDTEFAAASSAPPPTNSAPPPTNSGSGNPPVAGLLRLTTVDQSTGVNVGTYLVSLIYKSDANGTLGSVPAGLPIIDEWAYRSY